MMRKPGNRFEPLRYRQTRTRRHIAVALPFIVIFHFAMTIPAVAQIGPRTLFVAGMEYGGPLSGKNGSFGLRPGFLVGFATGIPLFNDSTLSFHLGVDITISNIVIDRPGVVHIVKIGNTQRRTYDERRTGTALQIGLHPEYRFPVSEKLALGLYAGASAGIGMGDLEVRRVSTTVIDSAFQGYGFGPYDDVTSALGFPVQFDGGVNVLFDRMLIGLRFSLVDDVRSAPTFSLRLYYVMVGFEL